MRNTGEMRICSLWRKLVEMARTPTKPSCDRARASDALRLYSPIFVPTQLHQKTPNPGPISGPGRQIGLRQELNNLKYISDSAGCSIAFFSNSPRRRGEDGESTASRRFECRSRASFELQASLHV